MRAFILSLCLTLVLLVPASRVEAQQSDIEAVISSQIDAFKADDFDAAFDFAHSTIRNIFRTPENFGRMVRQGYPMVWRPAEVEYLDLRQQGSGTFQDVRIVDAEGRVFLLEYSMVETADGWRIKGVRILESAAISA